MIVNRAKNKSLYKQIYDNLKNEIIEGKYKEFDLLPSERELSDRFQVDRITVRKSLELLVEDGMVEKKAGLGTIIKGLPITNTIQSGARNILFVMPKSRNSVDRITETIHANLFYIIEKECKKKDYSLIYTTLDEDDDMSKVFNGNSISGIFFVSKINEKFLEESKKLTIPSVLINNYKENFTSVLADNENGAYEAVKYLHKNGHERIGIILGIADYFSSQERFNGYKKALLEFASDCPSNFIKNGDWTFEGGFKAMNEIIKEGEKLPTAIFACNDITAFGIIEAIKEVELSVPGDISVIGFDNIAQCEYMTPKLTSVAVDVDTTAKAACQQLFSIIETQTDLKLRIVIPTKLVIRNSVENIL